VLYIVKAKIQRPRPRPWTLLANAETKDTNLCPRGSSRPRPVLEDYITDYYLYCHKSHVSSTNPLFVVLFLGLSYIIIRLVWQCVSFSSPRTPLIFVWYHFFNHSRGLIKSSNHSLLGLKALIHLFLIVEFQLLYGVPQVSTIHLNTTPLSVVTYNSSCWRYSSYSIALCCWFF